MIVAEVKKIASGFYAGCVDVRINAIPFILHPSGKIETMHGWMLDANRADHAARIAEIKAAAQQAG